MAASRVWVVGACMAVWAVTVDPKGAVLRVAEASVWIDLTRRHVVLEGGTPDVVVEHGVAASAELPEDLHAHVCGSCERVIFLVIGAYRVFPELIVRQPISGPSVLRSFLVLTVYSWLV